MSFLKLPHVASALQHPHKVLVESDELLLIHCTVSNVFVAECVPGLEESLCKIIKEFPVIRLQTSSQKLQQLLVSAFKVNYKCEQAVFINPSETVPKIKLELLHPSDLEFAGESYEMPEYMTQLYERKRLFGYYENNILIGYVAFHIDETVGALFVKPEYRKKGYGEKIMDAAACLYKQQHPSCTCFAQILSDNLGSIRLHQKLGCIFSAPVYWVYNQEYLYN